MIHVLKKGDVVTVFSIFQDKRVKGTILGREPNGAYHVDTGDYILIKHAEDLVKIKSKEKE